MTHSGRISDNDLSSLVTASREEIVFRAKLAEQADRYDDMANFMKALAEKGQELNSEERNMLSVAYKNIVGVRRSAWRVVTSVEIKSDNSENKQGLTKDYRLKIESELRTICSEVQNLLNDHLLKNAVNDESVAFYYKMRGDYYRYLAEVAIGDDRKAMVESSRLAYEMATKTAEEKLAATHPVRLGLALNFSVFQYEIMTNLDAASSVAQKAFDSAIGQLDKLQDDSYKDSALVMQLLRDNLTLWTTELGGDDLETHDN